MKNITIIGAGTAGLASATLLQNKGFNVTILEKNEKIGGRMNQIEINDFKFDVGPTIVMMKDIYEKVFTDTGVKASDYISLMRLEKMFEVHFKDGTILNATNDLVNLVAENESFSENDAQGYLRYLADIYKRYLIAKNYFIQRPFTSPLQFFNPKMMIKALQLKTFNNAYADISRYVKDEHLRQSLAFQTLYIGVSPYQGPSIYSIIPMIELLYGVWYIKGGMYEMAKAMERRFLELGGTIKLNENVTQIAIENKQVVGVISNDKLHQSDIVLSNVDFPYAMDNLVKLNKHKRKYTPKKIDKLAYSTSSFILYLGLKKKYPSSVHSIYFANDFKRNINDLFEDSIPKDPSYYIYSPTQIDQSLAPENKEVMYVLIPVPNLHHSKNNYTDEAKENYANDILNLIIKDPKYHDLLENIEVRQIYTPKDFESRFNLKFGATFGLKPTLLQSNYFRPQAKSKYVKNLYFEGSSNHPGAGVPIALTSGRIAAELIVKEHLKK